MSKVTTIPATKPLHAPDKTQNQQGVRRVAGYARVSTDNEDQANSYEAQVDYYQRYIKNHDGWSFAGIYTDEGVTGTSTKHREGFKQMVADALAGRIDLIVTKSVSRFARNTVDSLTTVRRLKDKGIEVFFEKENIWTLDSKGELLITIMSSLAQEESRSISENVTWGWRKRFSDGKTVIPYNNMLGWDKTTDGKYVINPEQAVVVRRIYRELLEGASIPQIARGLDQDGIPTPRGGKRWNHETIRSILTNEKYKGEALLQKTFVADFLTKTVKPNHGEVPQYYVEDSHPAIIDPDTWQLAQAELATRTNGRRERVFTGVVYCTRCGAAYGSKTWHSTDKYRGVIWQCNDKYRKPHPEKMPKYTETQLENLFQAALTQLTDQRELVDWEVLCATLADTTSLDQQLAAQATELEIVTGLIEKAINQNARIVQDQDEYSEQFAQLEVRHEAVLAAYNATRDEIQKRKQLKAEIAKVKTTLDNLDAIGDFDPATFHALTRRIDITPQGEATITCKDGQSITITITECVEQEPDTYPRLNP